VPCLNVLYWRSHGQPNLGTRSCCLNDCLWLWQCATALLCSLRYTDLFPICGRGNEWCWPFKLPFFLNSHLYLSPSSTGDSFGEHGCLTRGQILCPCRTFTSFIRGCDAHDKLCIIEFCSQFNTKMHTTTRFPFYVFSLSATIRRKATPAYNENSLYIFKNR
jgi:hypothetical protein